MPAVSGFILPKEVPAILQVAELLAGCRADAEQLRKLEEELVAERDASKKQVGAWVVPFQNSPRQLLYVYCTGTTCG